MIKSSSATNKINDVQPNYSTAKQDSHGMELKEGQIIKGEVIDLRYNSIRIRLEPGEQIIQAKLEANIPVSMGETARFQVSTASSGHLTLKYLPVEDKAPTDLTIEKALSASNLPLTALNKEIVEELLNHRMPIDKQTLQTLVRLSLGNPKVSPLTLVLMKKHEIPMTPENISQFEAYQKGIHQLTDKIQDLLNDMSESMSNPKAEPDSNLYNLHKGLLDLLATDSNNAVKVYGEINHSMLPLSQLISEEDFEALSKELLHWIDENDAYTPEVTSQLASSISDGSITLSEIDEVLKSLDKGSDNINSSQTDHQLLLTLRKLMDQSTTSKASTPGENINSVPYNINPVITVDSILNPEEIAHFYELLKSSPMNQSLMTQFESGKVFLQDIFQSLQEELPNLPESFTKELFVSEEYKKLILEAFHERWTLSTKKLMDKEAVTDTYQKLHKDLSAIEKLLAGPKDSDSMISLQQTSKNLQDNLNFLKVMNEMFTYLPLPIRLKQQDIHGDLYVFSKKENLNKKKQLNVLLHLDMTHLGPINIQVQMNYSQIRATFYTEEKEAYDIILKHLPDLTHTLGQRGYQMQANVEASYHRIDFSRDFIEQDSQSSPVYRYSFDIRT